MAGNYLVIPDLQEPFSHPKAFEFCLYLSKHYKVPKQNILCVGDETDQYWGSMYEHDPDALHTPQSELNDSIERLKKWYDAFPICRVAVSNHGMRWARKASKAGIPSMVIRSYKSIIQAPEGWNWQNRWLVDCGKAKVILTHGMEYSGKNAMRMAAELEAHNSVFGHHHSVAGIAHIRTPSQEKWSMGVGCLIDETKYAFAYGAFNRFKPVLGAGIICNDGLTPVYVPFSE